MVNDPSLLANIQNGPTVNIRVGNNAVLSSNKRGTLILDKLVIPNVLVVPGLSTNLISVGTTPGKWEFSKYSASLIDNKQNTVITAHYINGLYQIKASDLQTALSVSTDSVSLLKDWHERLGHLNVQDAMRLSREGRIRGLLMVSDRDVKSFECQALMGKGKRLPAPPFMARAPNSLEIVHMDIWGPATTPSINGNQYFLTCYDDHTRKIHLTFLKNKSDAYQAMVNYVALVEGQLNTKIKSIRSDNGGEFTSIQWRQFIASKGIEHRYVPPDAHAQNGRVERVHLTILNGVRTLLTHTGLPLQYWAEAANYMAYTRNHTPCGPQHQVPEDLWRKKKTALDHTQPFGSKCYFRDHRHISKLEPRYKQGLLLGYVEGTLNYRVWDVKQRKIFQTRDVVFSEQSINDSELQSKFDSISMDQDHIIIDHVDKINKQPEIVEVERPNSPLQLLRRLAAVDQQQQHNPDDDNQSIQDDNQSIQDDNQSIQSGSTDPLSMDSDEEPLLYLAASSDTPQSYKEAHQSSDWDKWEPAMKAELAKMDQYKVWESVD